MYPPEEYSTYKLKATVVTKDGLLANADWVHHRAPAATIFQANNNARPTVGQIQAMTDEFAALGWNAGKRRPTKSLASHAWWITDDPRPEDKEAGILAMIHSR